MIFLLNMRKNLQFSQSFVDYLGPTYFNSMNIQYKKNIHIKQSNVKKILYKWLFLDLS